MTGPPPCPSTDLAGLGWTAARAAAHPAGARPPGCPPGARWRPRSTAAGSTRRYTAWRKLQAEAHRQVLRVDARARAAEKARLRSFHRAIREQPNRLR